MSPFVDHDESMAEHYREYPEDALALLSSVLEDDDAMPGELLIVLRQMAKAFGGVPAIAEKAALNPTQLYRTLSAEGNPSLSSLTAILKAMGMRLAVKRIEAVDGLSDAAKPKARVRKKAVPARANAAQARAKAGPKAGTGAKVKAKVGAAR